MNQIWKEVVKYATAIGGAIASLFGGWDKLLAVLVAMMVIDYLSGVIVAVMGRSKKTEYGGLSSKVGAIGIAKKGFMLAAVLVAALLDRVTGMAQAVCRDTVIWFYIANEVLSFLENLNLAGVPFPAKIKEVLGQHKSLKDVVADDGFNFEDEYEE